MIIKTETNQYINLKKYHNFKIFYSYTEKRTILEVFEPELGNEHFDLGDSQNPNFTTALVKLFDHLLVKNAIFFNVNILPIPDKENFSVDEILDLWKENYLL